jgi:hypothetical protein
MTETSISHDDRALPELLPDDLAIRLMALPAKKRLEAILEHPDSAALVAALPQQDFTFTVMELGPDDALPLIAAARPSQLNLLFDLQWWRKDEILPGPALEWLERLALASRQNLLRWLYHADFELLVSLFGRWLRVAVVADDADLTETRDDYPPHTLDDQYFWEAQYPQHETLLQSILEFLFENHYGFYKVLLDQIMLQTNTAMMEEAFRFRRGRLEDLGIPDFYDALGIYQPITHGEVLRNDKSVISPAGDEGGAAGFALALLGRGDLLDRGLHRIHDPTMRLALQRELAALANKVVVADELIPEEAIGLKQAVDKVAAMVSLGLDLYSSGNERLAVKATQKLFLEHLFRLGFSQVVRARGRLQRLCKTGWLARWPAGIACLDDPWKEAAELLLAKNPQILRPGAGAQGASPADMIRSRRDLWQAKRTVDTVVALGSVFERLGADPHMLQTELWQDGQARLLEDVTLAKLLWTAAANLLWHGRWQVLPLPVWAWKQAAIHLSPGSLEQTVRTWLDQQVFDGAQRVLVETYLQPLFVTYREETAAGGPDGIPDPRFVTLFLFRSAE